ncbi:MAG: leucine-rich repeat domain-containing protein [Clostridiales bacterium]|nr:leucine-rich repeat domain-containing protein [Clostridiales bacterium]
MRWSDYIYERTEGGVVITRYLPEETENAEAPALTGMPDAAADEPGSETGVLIVPARICGLPVTEIGEEAFAENGAFLTKIELPPTVRRLGKGAFRMCMSLTELVLNEGLERIGAEAFYLTPLEELCLPDTVTVIEEPWELGAIRFRVPEKNPYFFTDGFCLYRREGEEQELLVALQTDERTEYEIADGTTVIGENSVSGHAALRRVVIPASVRVIREAAFEGCRNLSEVVLQEGLREIEANAFSHCICLKRLHLPASVEEIGRYALSDTFGWSEDRIGLERITVSEESTRFFADEDALFEIINENDGAEYDLVKYFGRKREYPVPAGVTRILPGAFRRASFRACVVPGSVRDVAQDAFRECKNLEEIVLEESGARLCVPARPVYRKEEITGLFFSSERRAVCENPADPFEMPEKWRSFADAGSQPPKREPGRERYKGYVYDYRAYDDLFDTYLNLPDQCGMACCRLKYPVLLEADRADRYREFVGENLEGILTDILKKQDLDRLALLAELGFFTVENIESCLELSSRAGQGKCTAFLLNYKREHLGEDEFDFSI